MGLKEEVLIANHPILFIVVLLSSRKWESLCSKNRERERARLGKGEKEEDDAASEIRGDRAAYLRGNYRGIKCVHEGQDLKVFSPPDRSLMHRVLS
jgi:hypothetical protein